MKWVTAIDQLLARCNFPDLWLLFVAGRENASFIGTSEVKPRQTCNFCFSGLPPFFTRRQYPNIDMPLKLFDQHQMIELSLLQKWLEGSCQNSTNHLFGAQRHQEHQIHQIFGYFTQIYDCRMDSWNHKVDRLNARSHSLYRKKRSKQCSPITRQNNSRMLVRSRQNLPFLATKIFYDVIPNMQKSCNWTISVINDYHVWKMIFKRISIYSRYIDEQIPTLLESTWLLRLLLEDYCVRPISMSSLFQHTDKFPEVDVPTEK